MNQLIRPSLNNLRSDPEYLALAELIKSYSASEAIDYCPSPGNWGDALINLGTFQFLNNFKIAFREIKRKDVTSQVGGDRRPLLVVGGGGGWCKYWNSTAQFVKEIANSYGTVIVLPSSYEAPSLEPIADITNVILTSRESDVPVGHRENLSCHDMAFFIDFDSQFHPAIHVSQFSRLHAFREDRESLLADHQRPRPNFDLSLLGNSYDEADELFSLISRFANVSTDRLHIGIAACLLDVNSKLYSSAVTKIPNVYDKSISPRYNTCVFSKHDN